MCVILSSVLGYDLVISPSSFSGKHAHIKCMLETRGRIWSQAAVYRGEEEKNICLISLHHWQNGAHLMSEGKTEMFLI